MSKEPKRNVYVGHRYVPLIMDEWDKSISYEGLSIVTYKGGSYTSKKRVPVGIDIKNTEYWAMTGNYDAQVEGYRKEVKDMEERVNNEMSNVDNNIKNLEKDVKLNTIDILDSNYIQDVSYSSHYDSKSETGYYITVIKHKDEEGNINVLHHDVFINNQKTIREFAVDNNATVAINAGYSITKDQMQGLTMVNGEVVNYKPIENDRLDDMYILGIKKDNTMMSFRSDTSITELKENGIYNAITAFTPLIEDGLSVSDELLNVRDRKEKHPRQVIGQLNNKDIIIMSTGGRGVNGKGMTASELVRILFKHGAVFAHMLDGGGSVSTVVNGVQINRSIDARGTTERTNAQSLYIKKNKTSLKRDSDISNIFKQLGNVKQIADSKSGKYNLFSDDIKDLDNNWGRTLYIKMDETGLVNLYGSITVGDKGVNQSMIVKEIPEKYHPLINVTSSFIDANSPWDVYNGFVVTNDGMVVLRGEGNNVPKGTVIHVNVLYKVNY